MKFDLSSLSRDQQLCLIGALEQNALILNIKGEWYAAVFDTGGYWIYELRASAPEYYVHGDTCTCPAAKPCKHVDALKVTAVPTETIPWRKTSPKRSRRGPR